MNAPALRSTALPALVTRLAAHFDMVDVNPAELIDTLKQTAFKNSNGVPSDAQMTALLVVANQYHLNPWTKEIYAFPAKGGGIVPIVGIDGWLNIINNHPQFDGMEFEYDHGDGGPKGKPVSVTCVIYRKDRTRPTRITEFYDECYRATDPWNTMARRMLRTKAIIQCGRVAFSYGGIYDPEEGEVAAGEKFMGMAEEVQPAGAPDAAPATPQLPTLTPEAFAEKLPTWRGLIATGQKTVDRMVSFLHTKYTLTPEQEKALRAPASQPTTIDNSAPAVTYAIVASKLETAAGAKDRDAYEEAATLIGAIENPTHRGEASQLYQRLLAEFEGAPQ